MSRIIAGAGKGRRLKTAGGDSTRPTGARVRQSLFDILAPVIPGCRFLDAFAGNGGVGLEALSRGAARSFSWTRPRRPSRRRGERAGPGARRGRGAGLPAGRPDGARRPSPTRGCGSTSIYLDPPYDSDLYEPLLALLGEGPLLAEGGVVVAEHFHKRALPETIGAPRPHAREAGRRPQPELLPRASDDGGRRPGASPRRARRTDEAGGMTGRRASEGSLAVFPGSFDPITNGHLDIVDRGLAVFDRVRMAILVNPEKQPLFTVEERVAIIREAYRGNPRVEVDTFSGLLVDYAKRWGRASSSGGSGPSPTSSTSSRWRS